MVNEVLFLLWLALPAALANIAPIPVAKTPWLRKYNAPLDFGKTYRGKRIFGSNKTWRGLIAGIIVATLVFWLQQLAVGQYAWAANLTSQIEGYASLPTLILGPMFAIGALGGDAAESFLKRQRGIAPGKSWFPWDQLDSVIGTVLVIMPFIMLSVWQYVLVFAIGPVIHLIFTYVGWLLKLKDRPV